MGQKRKNSSAARRAAEELNSEYVTSEQRYHTVVDSKLSNLTPTIVIQPNNPIRRLGLLEVWEYRHLLVFFALRSIRGRYRPTMLGYGWVVARPLFICLAYILVFGVMLNVKSDPVPFPLFAFVGVAIYLFFAGSLTDVSASLVKNAKMMGKAYYPRLIAPLSSIFVNLMDFLAALLLVAVLMMIYGIAPGWQVLLLPFFFLGFVLTTFAMGIILAARSVKVRDVMQVLPVARRVLIYSMPCVYPITLIPEEYRGFYFLNPLATYFQGFRWALLNELLPPLWAFAIAVAVTLVALLWGLNYFNRVQRSMIDSI